VTDDGFGYALRCPALYARPTLATHVRGHNDDRGRIDLALLNDNLCRSPFFYDAFEIGAAECFSGAL